MQKFYEKQDITLFQGDCIEILNRATPESIDMIFADPPYMLSNGGISCQSGKVVSVNKGNGMKAEVWMRILSSIKNGLMLVKEF